MIGRESGSQENVDEEDEDEDGELLGRGHECSLAGCVHGDARQSVHSVMCVDMAVVMAQCSSTGH